jgi:site-specific DNA-methyltransferase (adenine-specific)
MVYPSNVLHLATECNNKNHSATFPESLPEWFIKLFTKHNDIVLDPFMGSGTTILVANKLQRNSIGVDLLREYYLMVKKETLHNQLSIFEPKVSYEKTKTGKYRKVR